MVFKSFSFDLGNSRKITTDIIFRSKSPKFRSKSPKFRSEFTEISFFEFEFPFRSELANFGEISAEISFPANGGIRKKNEKVNPGDEWHRYLLASLQQQSSHGLVHRVRVVGAAAADGRGGGGPVLPRAARRRGAPLGGVAAPGKGACGTPVRRARGPRRRRRRGGGEEVRRGEEAGARTAGLEADPVRLQQDPQHHHPQRPHRHLWCAHLSCS